MKHKNETSALGLANFLTNQLTEWKLARENYFGLDKTEERNFQFKNSTIKVQFNPERIRSSAAKVDKQSIAKRACFLCDKNRPAEQDSIEFSDKFQILINPFPIFKQHFTIVHKQHVVQEFEPFVSDILQLAKAMKGFSVFYNGPKCGASAPDHMHFQAGEQGFMPIENELSILKQNNEPIEQRGVSIWGFNNCLRRIILIEGMDIIRVEEEVKRLVACFRSRQPLDEEPMLNVISFFKDDCFHVLLFPRKVHRPIQFYAEDESQLLISPAAVDFGGAFITPREVDFQKISEEDIVDIFNQLTIEEDEFQIILNEKSLS